MDQLLDYLRAAGYQQKPVVDEERDDRSFSVNSKAVDIVPGHLGATRLGLEPVRIEIDNTGHVVSLVDLRAGQPVASAAIEGELLASVKDGDRHKKIAVQFSGIPGRLREAVLALEDQRFFSHNGIDWRGIARAFWADIREGEIVQGGSTITQQLIKNAFLTRDRTFSRKVKEAGMAVILESRLSKEDIFTLYCNDVYLGQSGTFAIHGFAQAAKVYFDKNLSDLTLAESALLAGLIPAPNRYSADRDPSKALARRSHVLDRMVATGAISPEEAETAKQEPLELKKYAMRRDYGITYFIDYAQRFIGERRGTDQPGSTFKPFVYASALKGRAFTAATILSDRPQIFTYDGGRSQYKPSNYHGGFTNRDVTLREALARSLNVPAVELAQRVGLVSVASLAEECGLARPCVYPSMALGTSEVTPLELAVAYTAFANGGTALRPVPIESMSRTEGTTYAKPPAGTPVFSPQVAYLMTSFLQSAVDRGTAARLRVMGLKGAIAGKTGTTRDGWFVGYTPNLVCAVWVGF